MRNDTTYNPEESLGMIVRKAQSALHQRLFKNFRSAGLEVTPEQWAIMLMLMKKDGIKQNEIASKVARNNSSITRIIDGLSEKGLVERMTHQTDRRTNLIYLTEEGRKLQATLKQAARKTVEEASEDIAEDKMLICKEVLKKVSENLK